ncbi:MAG: sulfite exporter TauE/SafE family protein [Candidatus Thermoplasmatota archaeon]
MDVGIVATSFVLGLSVSLSCLGICLPVLAPYIISKDNDFKSGFNTSVLFSIGRLIIYLVLGTTVFIMGSGVISTFVGDWARFSAVLIGTTILLYGAWIIFKLPIPKLCKCKYSSSFYSIIIGMLVGSFFCPALWLAILNATLTKNFLIMTLSIISFWLGSSIFIILAGTLSGGISKKWKLLANAEKVRDVCGIVLICVGLFYITAGLIG